jgi:hypothetical protein
METVTIIFKDATSITAKLNGNSFITDEEPRFPDDMTKVIIRKEDGSIETIRNAEVQECASTDGKYWFTFVVATEMDKLQAQVLFTALETDTLIIEEDEEEEE